MFLRGLVVCTIAVCLVCPLTAWSDDQGKESSQEGVIQSLDKDTGFLTIKSEGHLLTFLPGDKQLTDKVALFHPGDVVVAKFTVSIGTNMLKDISIVRKVVSVTDFLVAVGVTSGFLLLLVGFILKFRYSRLIVGEDNRYSNSKFQIVVWFSVLVLSYLILAVLRVKLGGSQFAGGIQIPDSLLILSGLTAFTYAGAKGITVRKLADTKAEAEKKGGNPLGSKDPSDLTPKWSQLVEDDHERVDVGDFQLLMFTLIAAGMYLVQVYGDLWVVELRKTVCLPEVDETFVTVFGIGQALYLAKKQLGDNPAETPKNDKKDGGEARTGKKTNAPTQQT